MMWRGRNVAVTRPLTVDQEDRYDQKFGQSSHPVQVTAAGAGVLVANRYGIMPALAQLPPLEEKDTYTVGFAQTGSNNPWRLGESKSMQDEAARLGYTLVETNA